MKQIKKETVSFSVGRWKELAIVKDLLSMTLNVIPFVRENKKNNLNVTFLLKMLSLNEIKLYCIGT